MVVKIICYCLIIKEKIDTKTNKIIQSGVFSRIEFESYFNTDKFEKSMNKELLYKIYFIDACRGDEHSLMARIMYKNNANKLSSRAGPNERKYYHPESNRCVMHANSNNYCAYEAPFNGQDIDWEKLSNPFRFDQPGEMCGMLMNAVYHAYNMNIEEKGCGLSFSQLQDYMRDKTSGAAVSLIDAFDERVGIEIDESGNLKNKVKNRLIFAVNTTKMEASVKPGGKAKWDIITY